VLSNSFSEFLESGTSRSTRKLVPLHGAIACDIAQCLGEDYNVFSKGFGNGRESSISGRYMDKRVDIVITRNHEVPNGSRVTTVAGIAIKFVMQNYSQNSNNYFENMLGETANIRSGRYPYFQIFIIFDKLPYYSRDKEISGWETFTLHNANKYLVLADDNIDRYFHTPNKTLIYVVHIPDNEDLKTAEEYIEYYKGLDVAIEATGRPIGEHGEAIIVNDYEEFRDKVYHTILSL
jgi:hypothetical protein